MSMIIDLIIIAVALLCIIIHWHGGFVKSLISFGGFFLSVICGYLLAPMLGDKILPYIVRYFTDYTGITLSSVIEGFSLSARGAANIIAFGLIFIAASLVTALLKLILKAVFSLPVLKQADRFLGFVLGLVLALLFVNVLSILAFTCSDVLIRAFDFITAEMFRGSVVAKWIYEHNVFEFIMNLK